jgi:Holliday junction DNA helicase RuvA
VPGIGRKTAERLIVELRDKLEAPAFAGKEAPAPPPSETFQDAVAALMGLGYTAAQSKEALRAVSEGRDEPTLEDLVRRALARLSKGAVLTR